MIRTFVKIQKKTYSSIVINNIGKAIIIVFSSLSNFHHKILYLLKEQLVYQKQNKWDNSLKYNTFN